MGFLAGAVMWGLFGAAAGLATWAAVMLARAVQDIPPSEPSVPSEPSHAAPGRPAALDGGYGTPGGGEAPTAAHSGSDSARDAAQTHRGGSQGLPAGVCGKPRGDGMPCRRPVARGGSCPVHG